jgi:hypothetical protein
LAAQQLADAQEVDQRHHQELIDGFTHLADSMAGLTDVMQTHLENDAAQHRAEAEACVKESERLNDMLCMIFLQKSA